MTHIKIPTTRTVHSPVEVYTTEEAAGILKCSTRTVQRLIHLGRLQAFRLGWAYRVTGESLVAFTRGDGATEESPQEGINA